MPGNEQGSGKAAWWKSRPAPSSGGSTGASGSSRKRKQPSSGKSTTGQYCLDVGQKRFARVTCPQCGMTWLPGNAADEQLHEQHHNAATACLRFTGSSSERCVSTESGGARVLMVMPGDPPAHIAKVSTLCAFLEKAMGMDEGWVMRQRACEAGTTSATMSSALPSQQSAPISSQGPGTPVSHGLACASQPQGSTAAATTAIATQQTRFNPAVPASPAAPQQYIIYVTARKQVGGVLVAERITAAQFIHPPAPLNPPLCGSDKGCDQGQQERVPAPLGRQQQFTAAEPHTGRLSGGGDSGGGAGLASVSARAAAGAPGGLATLSPVTSTQPEQPTSSSVEATSNVQPNLQLSKDAPQARGVLHQYANTGQGTGQAVGQGQGGQPASSPAQLGVRAVWVAPELRRSRVATRMLNMARCHLVPGFVIPADQVAWAMAAVQEGPAMGFARGWMSQHTPGNKADQNRLLKVYHA